MKKNLLIFLLDSTEVLAVNRLKAVGKRKRKFQQKGCGGKVSLCCSMGPENPGEI
jgi:hypothetical protein